VHSLSISRPDHCEPSGYHARLSKQAPVLIPHLIPAFLTTVAVSLARSL
jgi:hypothetical protein